MVDWKLSAFSQPQERDIYRLTVNFYFAGLFLILEGVIRYFICIIKVRLARRRSNMIRSNSIHTRPIMPQWCSSGVIDWGFG
jgi:hypothetical protein